MSRPIVLTESELDDLERKIPKKRERVGRASDADSRLESDIQIEIVKALRKLGLMVRGSADGIGIKGTPIQRARTWQKLGRMGVQAGWPDLTILRRAGHDRVAFIELKRPGGVISDAQIERRKELRAFGFNWGAASSLDDALALLKEWGWL